MVAPLVVAAGRTAAQVGARRAAAGRAAARAEGGAGARKVSERGVGTRRATPERPVPQTSTGIQRSPAQQRTFLQNAKTLRQVGRGANFARHAIRGKEEEHTEPGTEAAPQARGAQESAQEKVDRLRFLRYQTFLGAQEEAENQAEKEERQKPSFIRYLPALAVATIKDLILDPVGIGSLPLIGTVVTLICSFLIFIFLLFTKKNGGAMTMRFFIRRFLIVLAGFVIEGFIFGVNFLPIEMLTVFVIYLMDKHLSAKQIAFLREISEGLSKKRL